MGSRYRDLGSRECRFFWVYKPWREGFCAESLGKLQIPSFDGPPDRSEVRIPHTLRTTVEKSLGPRFQGFVGVLSLGHGTLHPQSRCDSFLLLSINLSFYLYIPIYINALSRCYRSILLLYTFIYIYILMLLLVAICQSRCYKHSSGHIT